MNALKHLRQLAIAAAAVTGFGLMASSQMAFAQETPAAAPAGVKLVDAAGVQALQAKGAMVVDTRRAGEFAEGTIKTRKKAPRMPVSIRHKTSSICRNFLTKTRIS
jgi:hypothetical protein